MPLRPRASRTLCDALLLLLLLAARVGSRNSGGQSTALSSHSTSRNKRRGRSDVPVRVLQRHRRAPIDGKDAESEFADYDEVTVEFLELPDKPISHVVLRLPERQQCEEHQVVCTGYAFKEANPASPGYRKTEANRSGDEDVLKAAHRRIPGCILERGPGGSHGTVDVVASNMVAGCSVDNRHGDGDPGGTVPRRSVAMLRLKDSGAPSQGGWRRFTIKVRNPPSTPFGTDARGDNANAFLVVLKSRVGDLIDTAALPAEGIRGPWVCTYTEWMRSSPCTARCGGGKLYYFRRRLHSPPSWYDPKLLVNCDDRLEKTDDCNVHACDVDCVLGDWTSFADGPCTATCGGGLQVMRRRVIEGPMGKGERCPPPTDQLRVQYEPCGLAKCPHRCELAGAAEGDGGASATAASGRVSVASATGPCSQYCGTGSQTTYKLAVRKDSGFRDETCRHQREEHTCNLEDCKELDFFPGVRGQRSVVGKWHQVAVVFRVADLAMGLDLTAPTGFQLGKDSNGVCLLEEHSLPRLQNCMVLTKEGRDTAVFQLLNPLEPPTSARNGRHQVRLWVKHPAACKRGADPMGACMTQEDAAEQWTLRTRTALASAEQWESISGSYTVYQGPAPPRAGGARAAPRESVSEVEIHALLQVGDSAGTTVGVLSLPVGGASSRTPKGLVALEPFPGGNFVARPARSSQEKHKRHQG